MCLLASPPDDVRISNGNVPPWREDVLCFCVLCLCINQGSPRRIPVVPGGLNGSRHRVHPPLKPHPGTAAAQAAGRQPGAVRPGAAGGGGTAPALHAVRHAEPRGRRLRRPPPPLPRLPLPLPRGATRLHNPKLDIHSCHSKSIFCYKSFSLIIGRLGIASVPVPVPTNSFRTSTSTCVPHQLWSHRSARCRSLWTQAATAFLSQSANVTAPFRRHAAARGRPPGWGAGHDPGAALRRRALLRRQARGHHARAAAPTPGTPTFHTLSAGTLIWRCIPDERLSH